MAIATTGYLAYLNDGQGLVNSGLGVEGQLGVDLGGDLAGDDLENLLAELDEQAVEGGINLLVDGLALGLAVGNGSIDQSGVLGLLGGSQDQGGVGGGILGLVLADGWRNVSMRYGGGQGVRARTDYEARRMDFVLQAKSPGNLLV